MPPTGTPITGTRILGPASPRDAKITVLFDSNSRTADSSIFEVMTTPVVLQGFNLQNNDVFTVQAVFVDTDGVERIQDPP